MGLNRLGGLAGGFLVLALITPCLHGQQVERDFKNPPKTFRPMVRWWWPGGDVNDAELKKEVDELDQGGFGGGEIQPFDIGLRSGMPADVRSRVDDYLTPSFYGHVRAVLEEARSRGMWMDYTFGSGWPFGGDGVITPELASVELRSAHQTIRGPVHFHAKLAMPALSAAVQAEFAKLPRGLAERFKQREKLVAVVAVRGSSVQFYPTQSANRRPIVKTSGELIPGTAVVLSSHLLPDETFDWDVPPGVWQVFTFKEMPTGETVAGGVGSGPQWILDHMSRKAFDVYAERVGGTAKKYDGEFFGNTLRALFCDSLEVNADLYWSDDFLNEFKKLRGYDLTPYLPILKIPGIGVPYNASLPGLPLYNIPGLGDRVRRDYWQTVSDIMIRNFYEPFNQWASENHLLSRVQAHGSPTDILRVYGESGIPETEDLYDNGRYDFLKMSSSAGDLYGRKIVSSESFVWGGHAYQTTPEKIKRFADELITAGINEIIYHGFPYRYMDRPFPGWHPFALGGAFSSDVNPTNPFWPYFPEINAYITRLQYISQSGTTSVPVALYRGKLAYDYVEPARLEPEIDIRLMDAGYNFDHIDASILLDCKVEGRKLVSSGGARYSVLVLPRQKSVSAAVASRLESFADQGLPIVFMGGTPGVEPGVENGKPVAGLRSGRLQSLIAGHRILTAPNPAGIVEALKRASIAPNLRFDGAPLPFIEKRIGSFDAFFLRNPTDAPVSTAAEFASSGAPQWWNPWNGDIHPVEDFSRSGGQTRVTLNLEPYGSALLVFDATASNPPAASSAPYAAGHLGFAAATPGSLPGHAIAVAPVGEKGWEFHGVGIGPGSKPQTVDLTLANLADWTSISRLKNFSGRGEYIAAFNLPAEWLQSGRRVLLDLGSVKDAAEISINGKQGADLLLRPYEADVTEMVHAGRNTLQVTVVNTLYNALSANGPSLNYSSEATNTPNGLLPSGLIGPVVLRNFAP